MTHADLRPLRRSIGIAPFHFILVFAFMFRVLNSFGLFFRSSVKISSGGEIVTIYVSIVFGGELGIRNVTIS